jgi:hypothetical protein
MTDRRLASAAPATRRVNRSTPVSAPAAATTRGQRQRPATDTATGAEVPPRRRPRPGAQTGAARTGTAQPPSAPVPPTGAASVEVSSRTPEGRQRPEHAAPSHPHDLAVRHRKAKHTMVAVTALCVTLASAPAIDQLVTRGLTAFITRPPGVGASPPAVPASTDGNAETPPTTATPAPTTAPASSTTPPALRSSTTGRATGSTPSPAAGSYRPRAG